MRTFVALLIATLAVACDGAPEGSENHFETTPGESPAAAVKGATPTVALDGTGDELQLAPAPHAATAAELGHLEARLTASREAASTRAKSLDLTALRGRIESAAPGRARAALMEDYFAAAQALDARSSAAALAALELSVIGKP